jgi:hypothetical protein
MIILLENGERANLKFYIEKDNLYYVFAELETEEDIYKDCSGAFESLEKAEEFLKLCEKHKVLPTNIAAVYEDRLFIDILEF